MSMKIGCEPAMWTCSVKTEREREFLPTPADRTRENGFKMKEGRWH